MTLEDRRQLKRALNKCAQDALEEARVALQNGNFGIITSAEQACREALRLIETLRDTR